MPYVLYGTYGSFQIRRPYCPWEMRRKTMVKIKPCEICKLFHDRQYENHHSMITETVTRMHGCVAFLPVPYELPRFHKGDRVRFRTGLRRAKSERKPPSQKTSSCGAGSLTIDLAEKAMDLVHTLSKELKKRF